LGLAELVFDLDRAASQVAVARGVVLQAAELGQVGPDLALDLR
jgi:hypothetical protein